MEAIQQTIRPDGSTVTGRLYVAIVVGVLVIGLLAGFGLGRIGSGSDLVPGWPTQVGPGPGHVPRVWVERS